MIASTWVWPVALASLLAGRVAAAAGELSLRGGAATHGLTELVGDAGDDDWGGGLQVVWSPRATGSSRLILGASYWGREVQYQIPDARVRFHLVPVQAGIRFFPFGQDRSQTVPFVEIAPGLTYARVGIEPEGSSVPPYRRPGSPPKDHLLLGATVSGAVAIPISSHLGAEAGLTLNWTEGFETEYRWFEWASGFTLVALQVGVAWR